MTAYSEITIPGTSIQIGDRIGVFGRYSDNSIVTSLSDGLVHTSVATFAVTDEMVTVERPHGEQERTLTMSITQLKALHEMATEARNLAHAAYVAALANHQQPGDTNAAYQSLLMANRVRERIYRSILDVDV